MKILLTLFVLLFSSSVVAEDIRDFQIEGMTLGDSMLEFLTKQQIDNNSLDYYRIDEFIPVRIEGSYFNSKIYEFIEFNYKSGDENYIIYNVSGMNFPSNIKKCYKTQKEIMKDVKILFKNVAGVKEDKIKEYIHGADPSGKSTYTRGGFIFNSGDRISIDCNNFSNGNYEMYVSIDAEEFFDFLMSGRAW